MCICFYNTFFSGRFGFRLLRIRALRASAFRRKLRDLGLGGPGSSGSGRGHPSPYQLHLL